jgi:hypothetical protein
MKTKKGGVDKSLRCTRYVSNGVVSCIVYVSQDGGVAGCVLAKLLGVKSQGSVPPCSRNWVHVVYTVVAFV